MNNQQLEAAIRMIANKVGITEDDLLAAIAPYEGAGPLPSEATTKQQNRILDDIKEASRQASRIRRNITD